MRGESDSAVAVGVAAAPLSGQGSTVVGANCTHAATGAVVEEPAGELVERGVLSNLVASSAQRSPTNTTNGPSPAATSPKPPRWPSSTRAPQFIPDGSHEVRPMIELSLVFMAMTLAVFAAYGAAAAAVRD
jgi:hypothetical protein